jgi:hypothetical protein
LNELFHICIFPFDYFQLFVRPFQNLLASTDHDSRARIQGREGHHTPIPSLFPNFILNAFLNHIKHALARDSTSAECVLPEVGNAQLLNLESNRTDSIHKTLFAVNPQSPVVALSMPGSVDEFAHFE